MKVGMVPTWTGKMGKPGKTENHFPVSEISGNLNRLENSGNSKGNIGKVREF